MAGLSDIEWTDATWNPVAGCRVLSAGCKNCYAMRMASRLQAMGLDAYQGTTKKSGGRHVWTGKTNLIEDALAVPLSWKKPRLVFVNSMSDLFQDSIPFDFLDKMWGVMEQAQIHTFQILTKRPERMAEYLERRGGAPLKNVWLGTSVENQKVASRIEVLRKCDAVIRFISFEPLIGSVGKLDLSEITWAIVGGESGPRARALNSEWVEQVLLQCEEQGVRFFFKQWGGVNKKKTGRVFKGRTWDEMPDAPVVQFK
jgi:protein gp37